MAAANTLPDQLAAILREHRYSDSALTPCLRLLGPSKRRQVSALLADAQLMVRTCASANGYMAVHDFDAYQRYCATFADLCGLPQRSAQQRISKASHEGNKACAVNCQQDNTKEETTSLEKDAPQNVGLKSSRPLRWFRMEFVTSLALRLQAEVRQRRVQLGALTTRRA